MLCCCRYPLAGMPYCPLLGKESRLPCPCQSPTCCFVLSLLLGNAISYSLPIVNRVSATPKPRSEKHHREETPSSSWRCHLLSGRSSLLPAWSPTGHSTEPWWSPLFHLAHVYLRWGRLDPLFFFSGLYVLCSLHTFILIIIVYAYATCASVLV